MTQWHAPVASFAKTNGYVFSGDLAFCTVKASVKGTTVDLWISNMGPGRSRGTLAGTVADLGVMHCRVKAPLVHNLDVVVRRRTLFDRLISRGNAIGDADFDAKYIALGKEDDIRRLLSGPVVRAFVDMWQRSEGLCVEDSAVALEGGQFSLDPKELAFIVGAVSTIAAVEAN